MDDIKQLKSYNIFDKFLILNTVENKKRATYLIPLIVAQEQFELCIDCGEEFLNEDLQPLFDNFGDVEINFELLIDLLNADALEEYKFTREDVHEMFDQLLSNEEN